LWILSCHAERPDIIRLNMREIDFLENMTCWDALPSERQAVWLEAIEARVEGLLPGPSPAA
jgi:hypothetical protein